MSAIGPAALVGALAAGTAVVAAVEAGRAARLHRTRHRWAGAGPAGDAPQVPIPPRLAAALVRAGVDDAERAVLAWLGAVALAALVSTASAGGRLALVVVLVAPPIALRAAGGRLARRRTAQLPEALDAVGAGLRGGLGLAAAIEGAASVGPPLGPELARVGREVAAGRPLEAALERWRTDAPDASTALAGAALELAAAVGGPGARAVDGAAASLRDRLAAEAETDALATQAKASAAVLTLAPIAFAVLLSTLDPTAGRFLVGTPAGWLCITAGLALDAAGAVWMSALVRRSR